MKSVKDRYSIRRMMADLGLKTKSAFSILIVSLLLCCTSVFAQEIKLPERPDPPHLVNDMAAMLSAADAQAIEQKLVAYSDSTSTQIAVVIIPTIGGAEINQFATELFHSWGIGQKGKDNGVLLFIAKDDHKLFILTGRGVEEFLPDAICKRIIDRTIQPAFKAGQFAVGINSGTDEMMARLSGQFVNEDQNNTTAVPTKFKLKGIIIAIILIFLLASLFGGGGGQTYSGTGASKWWLLFALLNGMGGGSRRGGGDWGGGGGGGGFGGFGGGDSGGGGAGGSW